MDAFLDKVEVAVTYGDKAYKKVERTMEPAVNAVTPHLDSFAKEMDPLLQRPLDWIFFCYFTSHIPITLFIDLQALYPQWIIPEILKKVYASYVYTMGDPFMDMSRPLAYWFRSFAYCEAFLQLPFFFFAAYGVLKDKSWVRLPLAIYGAHVTTTVVPCLAEVYFNQELFGLSNFQRNVILSLYFPYFLIPLLCIIDSYQRITSAIKAKDTPTAIEKKKD